MAVRARITHLLMDEELEGFTGEEEEASCGVGDSLLKDFSKACKVSREICGSGRREAAAFKA